MAYQPVYPHPPPLLDTPAVCIGNIFIFISSLPSLPHILAPTMDACYATNCISSTSLPRKKKERKTHNFLPNILSLDSTCSFLIIFYSVVARIAGTEPCIILLKKSPIPKLALIWLKLASCSCLRYVYFQPRPQAWRL